MTALKNIEDFDFLVNFIATTIEVENFHDKVTLLKYEDMKTRAMQLLNVLDTQVELLKIKQEINSKVKNEIDQQQRENNQLPYRWGGTWKGRGRGKKYAPRRRSKKALRYGRECEKRKAQSRTREAKPAISGLQHPVQLREIHVGPSMERHVQG